MTPALVVGVIVAAALVFGIERTARRVLNPAPRPIERSVPEIGIDYEDLRIQSGDHELAGFLIKPPQAQPFEPLLLVAHGWSAHHGTVLRLAEPLAAAGHDVLLVDVSGHGRNPRIPYVTIRMFRDDLMAITRYAAKRFPDRQLVVIGHSMGGSAGVLAAADGAPIDGLVLIAAPADVLRVTAEFLTSTGMPGALLVGLMRPSFWARVGGGFRPLTPSRRIREVDVPVMVIQPEHDQRVAYDHAQRLSEAAGVPIHMIPGREHTDVLSAPQTLRHIEDFLEEL
ncbi:MAG: alpha/beta hydrolase [Gemmatimonadota bacterium]